MSLTENAPKPFRNMPPPMVTESNADTRTQPFWDATREQRLTAPKCTECGTFRMPPTTFCNNCLSRQLSWEPLPGTGTLYSFIIVRHPLSPALADFVPYVPAVIDADGAPGMRFLSNVVDCDPDDVEIGMRLRVVWNRVSDELTMPLWAPA